MTRQKISRNDPCPCGSGKKYKLCCYSKNIDWSARQQTQRSHLPRLTATPSPVFLGPFGVVDAKLKAVVQAMPGPAEWKQRVQRLSETTPIEERMGTYQGVREARSIPDEVAEYLFAWAIQWLPPEASPSPSPAEEGEEMDEEAASRELDQETLAGFRRFGIDDLAEMYANNRLEYNRRYERDRQFFFGPPDEQLAERLREKGIIE